MARHDNPEAFEKLRGLRAKHYAVARQMVDALGANATLAIAEHVREHLAPRTGHQLDAPKEGE
ncbi:MAG: hypothetical protein V4679_20760 [Pseudomonadota bacterium]